MTDDLDSKVQALISSLGPGLSERLSSSKLHHEVINRIQKAHAADLGEADASRLGMHMSDWAGDAAFVVALHLFTDKFLDEEIREGVGNFLNHAPNHIRRACELTGTHVWEDFPDEDTSIWEDAP